MNPQLNIYVDGNMYAMPEFAGVVPRQGERVRIQDKLCMVSDISYEFDGSPINQHQINVWLVTIYES